eukprot:PhF_6_TR38178/c0_g1_i2/m.57077
MDIVDELRWRRLQESDRLCVVFTTIALNVESTGTPLYLSYDVIDDLLPFFPIWKPLRPCSHCHGQSGFFQCNGRCLRLCAEKYLLWGAGPLYAEGSSPCHAALHCGAIDPIRGGVYQVEVAEDHETSFEGAEGMHGIVSSWRGFTTAKGAFYIRKYSEQNREALTCDDVPEVLPCTSFSVYGQESSGYLKCLCDHRSLIHADRRGGDVWGSGPYAYHSHICRSARHAGVLKRKGDVFYFERIPGECVYSYPGTTRNGVTSKSSGPQPSAFQLYTTELKTNIPSPISYSNPTNFEDDDAVDGADHHESPKQFLTPNEQHIPILRMTCIDNLVELLEAQIFQHHGGSAVNDGVVVEVACLGGRGHSSEGRVWGTGLYALESTTCLAAVHAGVLPSNTSRGGCFLVQYVDFVPPCVGSYKNGVVSKSLSYVSRGFRVLAMKDVHHPSTSATMKEFSKNTCILC